MGTKKSAILIGLNPDVVEYAKWPGLTAEKLRGALEADRARLEAAGVAATMCFVDRGATAEATVGEALKNTAFDCVLIGAGVRNDPDNFLLFEKLVNVAHRLAPKAAICFNTGPSDSVDAVQRWL